MYGYSFSKFFLLFYLQCPQIFLLLRRDSVALDCFLDGLVVRPGSKAALLDVGNRPVPLLGKGGGYLQDAGAGRPSGHRRRWHL